MHVKQLHAIEVHTFTPEAAIVDAECSGRRWRRRNTSQLLSERLPSNESDGSRWLDGV